ncbi:TIGR03016 family PEP-CTERM system-associated outer membrane protein [Muricoccus radiodurans]|uniref:TIGR03016 family PEP-CTERM system-associated outer membrane protein n=1 Tax=Muricoccus radiodurans TaxID=2231721 RepID=UPI003CEB7673
MRIALPAATLLLLLAAEPARAQSETEAGAAEPVAAPATRATTAADVALARGVPGGVPAVPGEMPSPLGGFFGVPFGSPLAQGSLEPGRTVALEGGISGQIFATDNIFPGRAERRSEVVGSITPDLFLTLDTARLQGRIVYVPTLQLYASDRDQDRLDHRLNASLLATLLGNSLFLDIRGSAGVQRIGGGSTDEDSASLPRRDRAQTASFSATPYYMHRFGGLATGIVGYTLQYSREDGSSRSLTPGGQPFFTPQEFVSNTAFGALRTGEDFGRLAFEVRGSGTTYSGDGVLDGAHRAIGEFEARYAITRGVAVLASVGYESQSYAGVPPIRISEAVWGFGVRLDPSPDTMVIARYQHRDGFNSPSVLARIALGARTVLFASYSDELTTTVRRAADLLTTTTVDDLGNATDSRTGSPTQASGGSLLALQNALVRIKRASIALSQVWDRDTITLSLTREERVPVSVARGTVAFQQESESIGLSWSRSISPVTTFIASAQFGRFESSTLRTRGDSYSARLTLAHQLTERLTASVQYQISNRFTDLADRDSAPFGRGDRLQNAVILTLRQSF